MCPFIVTNIALVKYVQLCERSSRELCTYLVHIALYQINSISIALYYDQALISVPFSEH